MKKITIFMALGLLSAASLKAQTVYDAAKISDSDLNGTARFVGMGGAMGALGGDISTMGVNPAGIGLYRSNDVMTSFGLSRYGTESDYYGKKFKKDGTQGSFDNIGFVFASKYGNATALRYINFGFNYHRSKSFYRNMTMEGDMGYAGDGVPLLQTFQMADMATLAPDFNYGSKDAFYDYGWLPSLGWQGGLLYQSEDKAYHPYIVDPAYSKFRTRERGGIGQYDFNVAFNLNDRVYLGMTVGIYDVDYTKSIAYDEDYGNLEGYYLGTDSRIYGTGFDVKFGAIIRPFAESPFRIGLALHTPTFYRLTSESSALLEADVFNEPGDKETTRYTVDTYDALGNRTMKNEYRLRTPWTYNVSLGYTIGSSIALGAEYEYKDYSSIKYANRDGDTDAYAFENSSSSFLKGVNTFRVGLEYKVIPQFAFRLGYNYSSDLFSKNAFKELASDAIDTDTDFTNKFATNRYTIGVGYRGSMFYADLAYQFSTYKSEFFPFINPYQENGAWQIASPAPTKVTDSRSQVLLTLGFRF